jgi:hypothetical protein
MFRDTISSTIPVAMTAIEVLCTDRFHKLRAVRKSPPETMWNAIQIARRATTIPKSRESISVDANTDRHDRAPPVAVAVAGDASFGVSTVVMMSPRMCP